MKKETCRFNEMMNACMNYIILLTFVNLVLLVQGFYGHTLLQTYFMNLSGNLLLGMKITFILVVILILFIIKYLFSRNQLVRRRFIRLKVSNFIVFFIFILVLQALFLLYLVYLGDSSIISNRDYLTIIERALPNLFIMVQVDLVIFSILGATCRRRFFM